MSTISGELHSLILNKENDLQFTKSIRWSKIAGIAAILAVALTLSQLGFSIYQYISEQSKKKQEIQQPKQNNQRPTKIQENQIILKNNPYNEK